ncbi:GNAT family N-acetyltransferase [Leptolyngbya sp. O-77]|uniref:GNAT family N-acetyltransferase n=1 Tax=Leptolyngbya sp. O-77 TaxID=1080068 RepID=UPI00074D433D|nr:GNAT family N-acetyltransferase [Leptolyngbya sp. O-77]BAU43021.1 putative acetyltransferase [Leptolyngbya sp. O-77]
MAITIRAMQEADLAIADHLFRLAFGTFIGLPDPQDFARTMNYMNRWYLDPSAAFVAEDNGQIVGSNIAVNWGSFGGFGPLTVHPDYWNQKVGQQLVSAAMDYFAQHQISQLGIFTFSNSPKHLALYERFGFHPRCLTAVMSKPVQPQNSQTPLQSGLRYSDLAAAMQVDSLERCAELTNTVFEGLDLSNEIRTVAARHWGETVLLESQDSPVENQRLEGFAICHCGEGTEAGKDACYVKFGAVRSGDSRRDRFANRASQSLASLLQACEGLAAQRGLSTLICGVNTERQGAYQLLRSLGFRIDILGVAMLCPNQPAFNHPGAFVLDDWR